MRIALIAPPFISVPPKVYGGTELFIAHLAQGLQGLGHKVTVYCNGESTVNAEKRWIYEKAQWPIRGEIYDNLKDLNHTAWAIRDACESCDLLHINNTPGLVCSRFCKIPFVYTLHHPHVPELSVFYSYYPQVNYVTISNFQRKKEKMPRIFTIHHGIDMAAYQFSAGTKREYLSFLGRIAPMKGTHLAIAAAQRAGMPLKIAGEVQPMYREYFEREIRPHVDGKNVEYIGEVDLRGKNELLAHSRALLFPIQWDEPFGLVMIESMACGAPVLALPGGAVPEIVKNEISGYICQSVEEIGSRARTLHLAPAAVRAYAEENFSFQVMARCYAELYSAILREKREAVEVEKGDRSVA
jgi:glycosyltransferase involved in cell wall biosynthesis